MLTPDTVAPVFGWAAASLAITRNLPQAWRTVLRGKTAGLTVAQFWVGVLSCQVWFSYGLATHDPVQLVANGSMGTLSAALLVKVSRAQPQAKNLHIWLPTNLVLLSCTGALYQLHGPSGIGYLGVALAMSLALPQFLGLCRKAGDTSGVSALSCWLLIAGCTCWFIYGLLRGQVPVWLPNTVTIALTSLTLVLLGKARRGVVAQPGPSNTLTAPPTHPDLAASQVADTLVHP